MDNCLFFKRRSSSYHLPLALRHFNVVLCKYQGDNNSNEKGTEMQHVTPSQNVTFSTQPGAEVAPAPEEGLQFAPLCLPSCCWKGRGCGTKGKHCWVSAPAGAATNPLLPPPPSRDGHLRLADPLRSAWAPLGALPKKQLCARVLEAVINLQDFFPFLNFFLFFCTTSQCNICFWGLLKQKARC